MLPGLCIAGGFGSSVASITYAGAVTNADTTSPVDFATVPIGTASSTRHVAFAIAVGVNTGQTATSVTVAGQATTLAINTHTNSITHIVGITNAPVTSGTTATISVTLSGGSPNGNNIAHAYAIEGLNSTTATDVDSSVTSAATLNMSISAGGVGLGFYGMTTTIFNATWNSGITEDAETASTSIELSAGHMTSATTQTVAVQATATGATSRWGVVTWR
jgi:hypothetical protein